MSENVTIPMTNQSSGGPLHVLVGRILNHKSNKICMCGQKVRWKRWRLNLCDYCSENTNLRQFSFSRLVSENSGTPDALKKMHEYKMRIHAWQYFNDLRFDILCHLACLAGGISHER